MKLRSWICLTLAMAGVAVTWAARADEATRVKPPMDHYPVPYPWPMHEVDATGTRVAVEVVEEGSPAIVYRDGGYRWVAGRRGESFAFRIENRNPYPIGVIPSADGQSLTADGRATSDNPAYIIEPYGSETIDVWRQNLRGGRALVFSDVRDSLAARKGDSRNVGVLGVLIWQLEDRYRPEMEPRYREAPGGANRKPSAPATGSAGASARASEQERGPDFDAGLGVGAGSHLDRSAYLTDRYRRVRVLDTVSIYYDDLDGLRRAGIDLDQFHRYYPTPPIYAPDRRGSQPFPDDGYPGVRIPE